MEHSLNRISLSATFHCLTGCAVGEVAGMTLGTILSWDNLLMIAVSIILAFMAGFILTMRPLLSHGFSLSGALKLAIAADATSIAVMESVDNGFIALIPGALDAKLTEALFWQSLVFSLLLAFLVAWPVNRFMISRGQGHAVVHSHH